MTRHTGLLVIALCVVSASQGEAVEAVKSAPPSASRTGLPSEVAAYLDRRTSCNHWGGEEAYNAQRGRQIAAAVNTLECDKLEADDKRLRQRYESSPEIRKVLDGARDAEG